MAKPFWRRKPAPQPDPFGAQDEAIVAAVSRVRKMSASSPSNQIPHAAWAQELWRQFDINGELNYGIRWIANMLSKIKIVGVEVDVHGKIVGPANNPVVDEILRGLIGSPARQAQMMSALGTHLSLPGDCYAIGEIDASGFFNSWKIYSTEEISMIGTNAVSISTGDGIQRIVDLSNTLVIRIYRPHPRRSWEANSPARSALPVLREMEMLSRYIFAVINSRLASNGIIKIPSEAQAPRAADNKLNPGESEFMAFFGEAMMEAIDNPGTAAALAPIAIQAPAAALAALDWIKNPNSELTTVVAELREKCIARLAIDLDLPPEVLMGTGSSSHWGQWAIEEQSIKLFAEPPMVLICDAFTEGFLRPELEAAGEDSTRYAAWYDATDLILRPDRGTDAKDLYDRGELSGDALREYTGFDDSDRPTGDELLQRTVLKLVTLAPTFADTLLPHLTKLFGLDRLDITPEDLIPVPVDGTPAQADPGAANSNPKALPPEPVKGAPNKPRATGPTAG